MRCVVEVVIDTNVLYVAEGLHTEASEECILSCVQQLQSIMRSSTVVIDDGYRVLGEYQNKLNPNRGKGVGTAFLKWVLQNSANSCAVFCVPLTEVAEHRFAEFPVPALEQSFDPPDRKFPAVSNAHPAKPPILQAVDCKWLRWWPGLAAAGIKVVFLCPDDVCRFFTGKFPMEPTPALPA